MKCKTCKPEKKCVCTNKMIMGGIALILIVAAIIIFALSKNKADSEQAIEGSLVSAEDRELFISNAVQELQAGTEFPMTLDESTTWTNVSGNEDSLIYSYALSNTGEAEISQESIEAILIPNVCGSIEMESILNSGISLTYDYTLSETGENFLIEVTSETCEA